ncbi:MULTISPECIES: TetR/AcrR family transcriptional regulator [Brevibacterium]|uniref:Transcriptional regulator, TetR family n=1 Tax=Brevibacterium antiquum CNRZ 918 TaxID=1255637 RepID=A0A2H1KZP7_9MICO|nr:MULTISPECIES: TetR/AcrR family transcriptional regulator [Brevibacterium]SMY05220.1 transcriptional regulator, TetR family [Brevibacterium antiquum CNRZ 918]HCG57189.1 TetR/AcrR family transcriptional regulator [Brevibacterium sp.]
MHSAHEEVNSKKPTAAQNPEPAEAKPVRSPNASPETADRIRTAAISEFATHGFTKSTIRSIASAAGVSPGLVIHHFGSKEKLRTVCDNHVFDAIAEAQAANVEYSARVMQMFFNDPSMATNIDYLMKSLLDPREHGQRHFEHYIGLVEDYIAHGFAGYTFRQSEDIRGQAATIATLALAPSMLSHRLQTSLGTNGTAETMTRLAPHLLDLYLNGIFEAIPDSAIPDDAAPNPTDPSGGDQP